MVAGIASGVSLIMPLRWVDISTGRRNRQVFEREEK
jgi:hypothetical protein